MLLEPPLLAAVPRMLAALEAAASQR